MKELLEFLTSKEIMVVYIVAGLACLLCFIIYLVEKNNEKLKRKQNTKELNRLVEAIKEEAPELVQTPVMVEQPILQKIESKDEVSSVSELLESTAEMEKLGTEKIETEVEPESGVSEVNTLVIEPMDIVTEVVEEIEAEEEVVEPVVVQTTSVVSEPVAMDTPVVSEVKEEKVEEELQYTSIEPDQATARLELEKLTEELRKQEEQEAEVQNIALTNYEEEQEENAIISLDELVKKSKEMYEANELTQYADEGNEPISLQDLEKKLGEQKTTSYDEPFIIENIVSEEDLKDETLEINQEVAMNNPVSAIEETINTVTVNAQQPVIEAKTTVIDSTPKTVATSPISDSKKFKSSPIISPIYGIEKTNSSSNELELENTANYEKLDEEIKKTNEFLMTLKELQKKLD